MEMKDTAPETTRHFQIDESYNVAKGEATKLCHDCWREEVHVHASISMPSFILYMVLTLGIFWFAWPSKCVCCGKKRTF